MLANRPGFRTCLCFAFGIFIASLPELPGWIFFIVLGITLLFASAACIYKRSRLLTDITLALLIFSLGFIRYIVSLPSYQSHNHLKNLTIYDSSAVVRGWITDRDDYLNNFTRFTVQPLSITARGKQFSPVIGKLTVTIPRADSSYSYGDEIIASGILQQPPERRNPGEINYRETLERLGIYAQVKVPEGAAITFRNGRYGNWLKRTVIVPMTDAASRIFGRFHTGQVMEFMRAIILNQRSGMEYEILSDFKDTGTLHILAVSGLHVVFIVIIAEFVLSILFVPKRLAPPLVVASVILYMLITGTEPPIMRAGVFLIMYYSGVMLQFRRDALNLVGVTALILLILNPNDLFDVGFQLSFGAVLGIYYFRAVIQPLIVTFAGLPRQFSFEWWRRNITTLFFVSIGATLGTMLILAYHFHRFSLGGILLNIIFVPASSIIIGLGFLEALLGTIIPGLGPVISKTLDALVLGMFWMNRYFSEIPYTALTVGHSEIKWLAVLLCAVVASAAVFSTKLKHKVPLVIAITAAAFTLTFLCGSERPVFSAAFLDVGQGDAAVVSFSDGSRYLIDGGDIWEGTDAGIKHIIPYLRWAGIRHLNGIIITHPNRDHFGGIRSVIHTVSVDTVYESTPNTAQKELAEVYAEADKRGITRTLKRSGDTIGNSPFWRIYVLSPPAGAAAEDTSKANENSLVLLVVYGSKKILFTGDINSSVERELIKKYG